jgi:hypothetical protein
MEWESYRVDLNGKNVTVAADDSNYFKDRNGAINANTGDTDASGLNITGATDSVIRGSESADEAPFQAAAAAKSIDLEEDEDEDEDEDEAGDAAAEAEAAFGGDDAEASAEVDASTTPGTSADGAATAVAGNRNTAASAVAVQSSDDDSRDEPFDFPYEAWVGQINGGAASAVNTDEGTTWASGMDALVVGSDGYDDDDIRLAGEDMVVVRDDGNVVMGGTGDVNAQIGDSEQGAVLMDLTRTVVIGGGAY